MSGCAAIVAPTVTRPVSDKAGQNGLLALAGQARGGDRALGWANARDVATELVERGWNRRSDGVDQRARLLGSRGVTTTRVVFDRFAHDRLERARHWERV